MWKQLTKDFAAACAMSIFFAMVVVVTSLQA